MSDRLYKSDEQYLRHNRIKPLPPMDKDIDLIIDSIELEEISQIARQRQFNDWAKDKGLPSTFLDHESKKRYVFMSGQSLVPVFKSLGYDIRHIIDANMVSVPDLVFDRIANRAGIDKPPLAGRASLDCRDGVILPYDWLVAAGLKPMVVSDVRLGRESGDINR